MKREVNSDTRDEIVNACLRAGIQYAEGLISFGEAQNRVLAQLQKAVDDAVEVE